MRVLALGGTGSVGKLVVCHALDQGHDDVALTRKPLRANITRPPPCRSSERAPTTPP